MADLVTARAEIPRLGDELGHGQRGILVDRGEERAQLVHVIQRAREGAGEIEAEPIDMHLGHPIAQAVHEQLEAVGMHHVQGVAAAREIHVVPLLALDRAIVSLVIDPAEGERGPAFVAFRGVVIDDVEDDLDARLMQRLHHGPELFHHIRGMRLARRVGALRREETQRVVTPVIVQPLFLEVAVIGEVLNGHQLDGRDPEFRQVLDDWWRRDGRIGPADLLGNVRVRHRQALDVRFVDHGFVPGGPKRLVVPPIKGVVDDDAQRGKSRAVALVKSQIVSLRANGVTKQRIVPMNFPADGLGVGIEQELVAVETQAFLRLIWPVHPVAVKLARAHLGQVNMPHPVGAFPQADGLRFLRVLRLIEQAEIDVFGAFRKQGEIRPFAIKSGALGRGRPRLIFLAKFGNGNLAFGLLQRIVFHGHGWQPHKAAAKM